MSKIYFDLKGSLSVDGRVIKNGKECMEVFINGSIITSGCADAVLAREIGVKNIVNVVDSDELLNCLSLEDLAEHIINKRSLRDIEQIYRVLSEAT